MQQVFSKDWFSNPKTQSKLLWLLNHSRYFRQDMGIQGHDLPFREKIVLIQPNSFTWRTGGNEFTTDFRTHNKFGKRLYYGFYPIWNLAHKFDISVANRWVPSANLGFDTLTAYPSPTFGSPISGRLKNLPGTPQNWATIRAGTGTGTATDGLGIWISGYGGTNLWDYLERSLLCFDTSTLTTSADISSAVISLYGNNKKDDLGIAPNIDIYTSNPTSTSSLTNSDFATIGTTSQTGSPIEFNDFAVSGGENQFTFNSTGRGNISKDGISKFGIRNANYDASGTAPSSTSADSSYIFIRAANYTDYEPKLVVTYSVAGGGATPHNLLLMGIG